MIYLGTVYGSCQAAAACEITAIVQEPIGHMRATRTSISSKHYRYCRAHPRLWHGVHSAHRRRLQVKAQSAGCRYAVIGAGFAGWAVAYHLLDKAPADRIVEVHVFDAVGIGAGGSGAAAGLLHPFSPNGKLLWRAPEAMQHALHLLDRAEEAAAAEGHCLPLSWPAGMVRPAGNLKQSQAFYQQWGTPEEDAGPPTPAPPVSSMQDARTPHSTAGAGGSSTIVASSGGHRSKHQSSILRGSCLSMQQALGLIPWLAIPAAGAAAVGSDPAADQPQQQQQGSVVEAPQPRKHRKQQQRKVPPGWSLEAAAALHVPSGITLHPLRYLQALHAACKVAAAGRKVPGSCVQLHVQQLDSVQELLEPGTSWDGVAVAAGAAVGTLKEFQGLSPLLDLCQGYTLDLQPSSQGAAAAAAAAAAEGGRSKAGDAGGRLAEQTPASDVGQQQEVYGQGSAAELTTAGPLPVANLLRATDSRDVSDTNISSSHTPDNPSYPPGAPSILGQPYLASQGGQLLVLGASQDHEWLPTAALQECYHSDWLQHLADAAVGGHAAEPGATAGSSIDRRPALLAAAQKLLAGAAAVWPPVVAWQVAGVRSGVRALPPRGPQGSIPLVGAWNQPLRSAGDPRSDDSTSATTMSSSSSTPPPIWLCVGLGARGLVYHAWLGALVAQGILDGSEQHIPAELLAWKAALGKVEAGSCSAPRPDGQQS